MFFSKCYALFCFLDHSMFRRQLSNNRRLIIIASGYSYIHGIVTCICNLRDLSCPVPSVQAVLDYVPVFRSHDINHSVMGIFVICSFIKAGRKSLDTHRQDLSCASCDIVLVVTALNFNSDLIFTNFASFRHLSRIFAVKGVCYNISLFQVALIDFNKFNFFAFIVICTNAFYANCKSSFFNFGLYRNMKLIISCSFDKDLQLVFTDVLYLRHFIRPFTLIKAI